MSAISSRKHLAQFIAALLVLLILYVAASAPLFRCAASATRHRHAQRGLPPDFSSPPPEDQIWEDRVSSFYQPMFRVAGAAHLQGPLFAYLQRWGLLPLTLAHNHVVVLDISDEPNMNAPREMKLNRQLIAILSGVLLAPMLYLLSSGPAFLFASKRHDQSAMFGHVNRFYRPLFRFAVFAHLEQPLSNYLRLYGLHVVNLPSHIDAKNSGLTVIPSNLIF